MEKINYQLILETYYPDFMWTRVEGSKGYEYNGYIWSESNSISKPTQEELALLVGEENNGE